MRIIIQQRQDADCLKQAHEAVEQLSIEQRKEIMEKMYQNNANDIFLFLELYSTL